jgi:hypothetical protein
MINIHPLTGFELPISEFEWPKSVSVRDYEPAKFGPSISNNKNQAYGSSHPVHFQGECERQDFNSVEMYVS